jgi:hypothetical protein
MVRQRRTLNDNELEHQSARNKRGADGCQDAVDGDPVKDAHVAERERPDVHSHKGHE